MKITSLEIDRFGIWEHIRLSHLSPGLNVFYGPNEAGKTTLMQFIRSSLYGCASDDRIRYIQMVLNSKGPESTEKTPEKDQDSPANWVGGSLGVHFELGRHRLARRYLRRHTSLYDRETALEAKSGFIASGGLASWSGRFYPIPGTGIAESLIVSGPDGARLSDYFVKTLVSNVDEATFNNVFAIGLDELQRLGSLNETDAAQLLYRLSVGVDRVYHISVLHQITGERNEIFDAKGNPAILDTLLDQRDRLARKSLEAGTALREYGRLLGERRATRDEVSQLRDRIAKNQYQKRLYELAVSLASNWDERARLREEIVAMGQVAEVPEEALTHSDMYAADVKGTRESLDKLRTQYQTLRQEQGGLAPDPAFRQVVPRIELLQEELPRLQSLSDEEKEVAAHLAKVEEELAGEELRLKGARNGKLFLTQKAIDAFLAGETGEEKKDSEKPANSESVLAVQESLREVEDFHVPARAVARARRHYDRTKEQLDQNQERLRIISEKLENGLTSRNQRNLTEALERTTELVSALRRRFDLARQLGELGQYRKELERVNAQLAAGLTLSGPLQLAVWGGVALGCFLFAFMLFKSSELSVGILGLGLAIASVLYKTTVEKKNHAKLEENQRQLGGLLKQMEQGRQEAQAIDAKFPASGLAVDLRLQRAQGDLAWFEKLLPLDSQWKETNHHVQLLQKRADKALEVLHRARKDWSHWLRQAGLPKNLRPSQIRGLFERVDIADNLRQQAETLRARLELCRREQRSILDHLDRVLVDSDFKHPELKRGIVEASEGYPYSVAGKTTRIHYRSPARIITLLGEALAAFRETEKKRHTLQIQIEQLFHERKKLRQQEHKERKEWSEFLATFGARTADDLINLAARYEEFTNRKNRRESVQQQIETALGDFCEETALAKILNDEQTRTALPALQTAVDERIAALELELQDKLEYGGRLEEQLTALGSRKSALRNQFDRASVELRIQQMSRLWQSRAVSSLMMEEIRKAYEKERQPETLREASGFLRVLTDKQYVKIWTPLGEDTLYVDTADGTTMDVSDLSRGTREQLFIAIRLALTVTFEKHGISLPLILDDVLVNFDNRRAQAAAKLLYRFAKAGRQIFLFTCHEHICKIFLGMNTPVHVLPARSDKKKQFKVLLPPAVKKMVREEVLKQAAPPTPVEEQVLQKVDETLSVGDLFLEPARDEPIFLPPTARTKTLFTIDREEEEPVEPGVTVTIPVVPGPVTRSESPDATVTPAAVPGPVLVSRITSPSGGERIPPSKVFLDPDVEVPPARVLVSLRPVRPSQDDSDQGVAPEIKAAVPMPDATNRLPVSSPGRVAKGGTAVDVADEDAETDAGSGTESDAGNAVLEHDFEDEVHPSGTEDSEEDSTEEDWGEDSSEDAFADEGDSSKMDLPWDDADDDDGEDGEEEDAFAANNDDTEDNDDEEEDEEEDGSDSEDGEDGEDSAHEEDSTDDEDDADDGNDSGDGDSEDHDSFNNYLN